MKSINEWVKRKDVEKNRYYGVIVGINDPLKDSRVQVRIPELHTGVPDNLLPFCKPKELPHNSNTESNVDIPPLGTKVEVYFEDEDFYNGVYSRGISSNTSREDAFYAGYPAFRGRKTSSGNVYKWYDSGDLEVLTASGHTFKVTSTGKIEMLAASGESMVLDNGLFTFTGNMKIIGTLEVTEATKLDSTLEVVAPATFDSTLNATGTITSSSDVIAVDKSGVGHTHKDSLGGDTTPPQ